MRVVIQRVSEASVSIEKKEISTIKSGVMILLGIEHEDTDENGNMNRSIQDIQGEVLLVSQFTLHAKVKKGNRPSFINAAKPEIANDLYETTKNLFESELKRNIATGKFGAMMQVQLVNDGPVTIILDTKNKE